MRRELVDQLQAEFPAWFRGLWGDPTKTCLAFGIECGDGWFDLIHGLCQSIKGANPPEEFAVLQVKEKFGGLRFYYNFGNEEIGKLVGEAEEESYKICEQCGTRDDVTVEGSWILTLCKKCRNK